MTSKRSLIHPAGRIGAPLIAAAALACLVALALLVLPGSGTAQVGRPAPNVLVVMTDDQTVDQLSVMPRTRQLIGEPGATFANSFVSHPICCPSRATFLTGQYNHNNGVLGNAFPRGGFKSLKIDETLAVWLQRAGYFTGQIGKVMNGYKDSPVGVPPGWSEWHGEKSQDRYYGYKLYENGSEVTYGDPNENPDDPADPGSYTTDVYTQKAVDFIVRRAPAPQPYFLWLSYNAPHSGLPDPPPGVNSRCRGNAKPAARHVDAFRNEPLPQPASFNEADVSDKPPTIRRSDQFDAADTEAIQDFYSCELASLLAVDEGVEDVMQALALTGELDNTLILFVSDNGFFHGEHRIPFGKNEIYEEAIRVPLLARGPGIPAGTEVSEIVSNVDYAPTILEAAGARAGVPQDGRSLLGPIAEPERERGRELVLSGGGWRGIRTARYSYAIHHGPRSNKGREELYDLQRDPDQLRSKHRSRRYADTRKALAERLEKLSDCAGRDCRRRPRVKLRAKGSCEKGRVEVRVKGRDTGELTRVEFELGDRGLGTDRREPFRERISKRRIAASGTELAAVTHFLDGRRATLSATISCG